MWCGTEVTKALCFIPGYTGFCPEYSQQIGKSYGHQTHHLMKENPHLGGRLSDTNTYPCIRIAIPPGRREREDSECQKCSTCTYERGTGCNHDKDVRPAGLPSEEMWRTMDLEGQRQRRAKEKKTRSSPKGSYSRHESHYPSNYQHYEGFREGSNREHCHNFDHGHYHPRDRGYYDNNDHGRHHHLDHGHHSHLDHGHHHHLDRGRSDLGYNSHKHKKDNPVSVSVCINPKKPKGKFYVPSVSGDYDLEKNKVCIQLPDKHSKNGKSSGDRMSCHNKAHVNSNPDYSKSRYYGPETRHSNRGGSKSHCGSSRNGSKPFCAGFIAGIQFCVGETVGNSSGRIWRGNCC